MMKRNVASFVRICASLCIAGVWSGCQTASPKPDISSSAGETLPGPVLQDLRNLEEDITALLGTVRDLEQARAEFARYFETAEDHQAWGRILVTLPGYKDAAFFPYANYLAERRKLQADLERRVELLDRQIRVLEEYVTSPDGRMRDRRGARTVDR